MIQVQIPPSVGPGQVFEVQYAIEAPAVATGSHNVPTSSAAKSSSGSMASGALNKFKESGVGQMVEKGMAKLAPVAEDVASKLGRQMESALAGTNNKHVNSLLDSALATRLLDQTSVPVAVRNAANQTASRQLQEAIESDDPRRLKGALVAAGRLRATNLPQYEAAVQRYREVKKLPPGWDVSKMALQRRGKRMVDKSNIEDAETKSHFQALLDMTHRKVYTRDRMGEPVPHKLELVSVRAVANDEIWGDYMARREQIRLELESDSSAFQVFPVETTNTIPEFDPKATDTPAEVIADALSRDWAPLQPEVNEVFLFHGTSEMAADAITTADFKVNLAGCNAGTLYGRGLYFAENASKSDEYTKESSAGTRYLLLCRVTLGRPKYLDQVEVDARECENACLRGNCHSILGDRRKCRGTFREFVVFDVEQVYPNYIIGYRRIHGE